MLRVLPHNLSEVTPAVKVGHGGTRAEVRGVVAELVVVHQVADHLANLVGRNTIANVLTVATAGDAPANCQFTSSPNTTIRNLRVMLVHTPGSQRVRARLQGRRPGERVRRVVAAVDIVIVENVVLVGIGGSSILGLSLGSHGGGSGRRSPGRRPAGGPGGGPDRLDGTLSAVNDIGGSRGGSGGRGGLDGGNIGGGHGLRRRLEVSWLRRGRGSLLHGMLRSLDLVLDGRISGGRSGSRVRRDGRGDGDDGPVGDKDTLIERIGHGTGGAEGCQEHG